MKIHSLSILLVLLTNLIYLPSSTKAQQITSPARAGFKEPRQSLIAGQPITLGVVFYTLCIEGVPPFTQTSTIDIQTSPGLVTVRVTGYCDPQFTAFEQGRTFSLNDLTPGIYDVRYEFYNFDGSFVSAGAMPGTGLDNRPTFPFTVLAPTQEHLDRVFRVPTLSQFGLAALALLIGVFGLRYFRKRAR
jgi:IPTL-CTERM motif